jgi:hypothetical protein
MVLLDTDVAVDVLRGYEPAIDWLLSRGDEAVTLPGFVAMELLQGCQNKRDQRTVRKEIKAYNITWPSSEACDQGLAFFAEYRLSDGLGLLDALIASLAVELNAPLHTFNEKHYQPILEVEAVRPYERRDA